MKDPFFKFDSEDSEGVSHYSAALLIQACVWIGLVLLLHKIYGVLPLTLALIFFGFGDFVFRFICVQLAIDNDIKVEKVSDVLTDQYLREVEVYDRLSIYVLLYGGAFLAGILCILFSLVVKSESFLLVGGLCSIASFLKLIPIYPTDGGLLVVQAMRADEPRVRIVFESVGFVALSILLSMVFSPVIGFILLIPALLLPIRYQSLLTKYSLLKRVEEYVSESGHEISDEEMEKVIKESPEMKSLELVYEEEDCGFFVESLIQEVPRKPLAPEQRRKLNSLYLLTFSLQVFFLFSTISYFFDVGEESVRSSIQAQNCKQASQDLEYFRPVLQLTGKYGKLRQHVSSCGSVAPDSDIAPPEPGALPLSRPNTVHPVLSSREQNEAFIRRF